jgi:carboxypeptidase Q
MKRLFPALLLTAALAGLLFSFRPDTTADAVAETDSSQIARIYGEALVNGQAYENLRGLCQKAPKRLSGSPGAQVAVEYMKSVMEKAGFDKVWLQPCMVPHWERGAPETAAIVVKGKADIHVNICALGGSQPTPEKGLVAPVVEVTSFEELEQIGKKGAAGKIVFFNHRFNESKLVTFDAYSEAVLYRWLGASTAEKYGAVGMIVRSVTGANDTFPHTGSQRSDSLAAKIPGAAISTKDADELHRILTTEKEVSFRMRMSCRWFEDVLSYNVIGEIRGSEKPEEVILAGGHLDAWDLGEGAHDDGAGCVQAVEAIRIFRALGIRPKHTIRAVCFMNEENGGRGGKTYADSAEAKKEKHIAAIETDAGGFSPRGFSLHGSRFFCRTACTTSRSRAAGRTSVRCENPEQRCSDFSLTTRVTSIIIIRRMIFSHG